MAAFEGAWTSGPRDATAAVDGIAGLQLTLGSPSSSTRGFVGSTDDRRLPDSWPMAWLLKATRATTKEQQVSGGDKGVA